MIDELVRELERNSVGYEPIPHRTTTTAGEEAAALGVPREQMFELGAVPPFGGPSRDRTIVDRQLAEQETVVLEAGTHSESVRIKTHDLLSLTKAELADICAD